MKSSSETREHDTPFMAFLKISLSRPRDIQRILKILQDIMKQKGLSNESKFIFQAYNSDLFQNQYSEYFLSSLKDQLSFYYSDEDYKLFIKFFDFFTDPQFSYAEYQVAYEKFIDYILNNAKIDIPKFVEDPKDFLQLLYDSNIVAAIENDGAFFHFSYRD